MTLNGVNFLVSRLYRHQDFEYIYIYMYRIYCNINIYGDMCLILNTCAIVQTLGVAYVFVDFSCVPSVGISQVCRQTHLGKMLSK